MQENLQNKTLTDRYLDNNLPDIAILVPHFNNKEGLLKTVRSLNYSGKIHLVIVDDGSDIKLSELDITSEIDTISYQIHLLEHTENRGIVSALNTGLLYINSKLNVGYTARIDAGDLQLNERFNKQVKFMEGNPKIGITGTSAKFVTSSGKVKFVTKYTKNNKGIRKRMGLRCSLLHPTVMYRQSIFNKGTIYPTNYPHAEDYAFFIELMKNTEVANLNEILTQVEYNENGISLSNRIQQLKSRIKIIYHNFFSSPYSTIGILYTAGMIAVPYRLVNVFKNRSL